MTAGIVMLFIVGFILGGISVVTLALFIDRTSGQKALAKAQADAESLRLLVEKWRIEESSDFDDHAAEAISTGNDDIIPLRRSDSF